MVLQSVFCGVHDEALRVQSAAMAPSRRAARSKSSSSLAESDATFAILKQAIDEMFNFTQFNTSFVGAVFLLCVEHTEYAPSANLIRKVAIRSHNNEIGALLLEQLIESVNESAALNNDKIGLDSKSDLFLAKQRDLWEEVML